MKRFGWRSSAGDEEQQQQQQSSPPDNSPARSQRSSNSSSRGGSSLTSSSAAANTTGAAATKSREQSPARLGADALGAATGAGGGGAVVAVSNKKMLKIGANVRFRGDVMECNTVVLCGRLQVCVRFVYCRDFLIFVLLFVVVFDSSSARGMYVVSRAGLLSFLSVALASRSEIDHWALFYLALFLTRRARERET